jgi:hypothetical protein
LEVPHEHARLDGTYTLACAATPPA